MTDHQELRVALRDSLPAVDQAGADDTRSPGFTFVPPSHAKALDIDSSVVEGIRGAGKSFWWAHLASAEHRRYVAAALQDIRLGSAFEAVQAFGAQSVSTRAPSPDVLAALLKSHPARAIWRTVLAHNAGFGATFPASANWAGRVQWVAERPEDFDELLRVKDAELDAKGIDPAKLKVSFKRGRTSWSVALKQMVVPQKLSRQIWQDEAGRAFVWITTNRPGGRSGQAAE